MSGSCNGCGRCCDPVVLPYRYVNLTGPQRDEIEPSNREWIENHLTEIVPRRAGLDAVSDYMSSGVTTGLLLGQPITIVSFFYRCDWYDPDTRECRAYDQRPPICSSYPWYDEHPDPTKAIPPQCGYNTDVGRPVAVTIGPPR